MAVLDSILRVQVEKHNAVVKERNDAIGNLIPPNVLNRPTLTDEELAKVKIKIEFIPVFSAVKYFD